MGFLRINVQYMRMAVFHAKEFLPVKIKQVLAQQRDFFIVDCFDILTQCVKHGRLLGRSDPAQTFLARAFNHQLAEHQIKTILFEITGQFLVMIRVENPACLADPDRKKIHLIKPVDTPGPAGLPSLPDTLFIRMRNNGDAFDMRIRPENVKDTALDKLHPEIPLGGAEDQDPFYGRHDRLQRLFHDRQAGHLHRAGRRGGLVIINAPWPNIFTALRRRAAGRHIMLQNFLNLLRVLPDNK